MQYPVEDLLADYRDALAAVREALGREPPVDAGPLLRRPFEERYRGNTLQERMAAFQLIMLVIQRHREPLAELRYVKLRGSEVAVIQDNLIRALHRLIVEKEMIDPPLREITEAVNFFSTRN